MLPQGPPRLPGSCSSQADEVEAVLPTSLGGGGHPPTSGGLWAAGGLPYPHMWVSREVRGPRVCPSRHAQTPGLPHAIPSERLHLQPLSHFPVPWPGGRLGELCIGVESSPGGQNQPPASSLGCPLPWLPPYSPTSCPSFVLCCVKSGDQPALHTGCTLQEPLWWWGCPF